LIRPDCTVAGLSRHASSGVEVLLLMSLGFAATLFVIPRTMTATEDAMYMNWLKGHETSVMGLVEKTGYKNPMIGSLSEIGIDAGDTDIVLMVTRGEAAKGLLSLVHLEDELTSLLGIHIEVCTEKMIPDGDRLKVLQSLTPIIV
jgi:predicted nucleotidyltransferase